MLPLPSGIDTVTVYSPDAMLFASIVMLSGDREPFFTKVEAESVISYVRLSKFFKSRLSATGLSALAVMLSSIGSDAIFPIFSIAEAVCVSPRLSVAETLALTKISPLAAEKHSAGTRIENSPLLSVATVVS